MRQMLKMFNNFVDDFMFTNSSITSRMSEMIILSDPGFEN